MIIVLVDENAECDQSERPAGWARRGEWQRGVMSGRGRGQMRTSCVATVLTTALTLTQSLPALSEIAHLHTAQRCPPAFHHSTIISHTYQDITLHDVHEVALNSCEAFSTR